MPKSTDKQSLAKEIDSTRQTMADMLKNDKAASDVAKVAIVEHLTKEDLATDVDDRKAMALAILGAINSRIHSKFLYALMEHYTRIRKSVGRKDRKELVEMFKAMAEEPKKFDERVRDLLGVRT